MSHCFSTSRYFRDLWFCCLKVVKFCYMDRDRTFLEIGIERRVIIIAVDKYHLSSYYLDSTSLHFGTMTVLGLASFIPQTDKSPEVRPLDMCWVCLLLFVFLPSCERLDTYCPVTFCPSLMSVEVTLGTQSLTHRGVQL